MPQAQRSVILPLSISLQRRQSDQLPAQIPLNTLPIPQYVDEARIITTLGRYDDDSLSLFTLDWEESGPHFIVTGPPGSGKTNMLRAAVLSAAQHYPPEALRFLLVDFNGRSLRPLDGLKHVIKRVTDVIDLQAQLTNLHNEMNVFYAQWHDDSAITIPRTIIVFDDYDAVSEALSGNNNLLRHLRDHVRLHSELGLHIWIAGYLERIGDPLIKQLLLKRSGFGLSIRDSLHNLNVRVTDLPGDVMPAGRAYFAEHNTIRVVQTALAENPKLTVNRINAQVWADRNRSSWENPVDQEELVGEDNQNATNSKEQDDFALDIDTEGLIQDLLGGQFDE